MLKIKISLFFLAFFCHLAGQIDTEFWFAAPDISSEYGQAPKNGAPINLHFTALYPTTVTISRPADPGFAPIVLTLQELEHKSVELNTVMLINQIETYPRALTDPTAIQNKGFKITAYPGEITCYYELDNKQNKDMFPLKGRNGLGKEFFVSTQNVFPNGDYKNTAWSGFVIVATENNTTVNVELNDDLLYFTPHPPTVTINMDAGQTYAFRSSDISPGRHINGIRVTSDNNIAITVYDDALQKERTTGGTSWDLIGDQIVPLDIVGDEYIVMKGFVEFAPGEDGGERIFITATMDNTQIFVDGNPVPEATINKGEVFVYEIFNQTTHIGTSEPVFMNHITGFEADLGGAILPPIGSCSGSYDVAFSRSPDPSENFYMNIMVRNVTTPGNPLRNQAVKNFSIVSNGITTPIPESYFTYVMDSSYAVLKRDPVVVAFVTTCIEPGYAAMVRNPISKFHLGIINGHINTGCKYGYFSDYKVINSAAGIGGALSNTREVYCDLDPIRLVARGGLTYEWTCTSDPAVTSLISDPTIADPFFMPETSGNYMFNVHVIQDCGPSVDLPLQIIVMYKPIANFDIDAQEACSPFTANITHHVDVGTTGRMEWYFDYPRTLPVASQDTMANPFTWSFPENNTDSVVAYKIRLFTWAPFNTCPDQMEKTILIKPGIHADFSVSDSAGCHPMNISFNNLSTGHLADNSYYWEFGDNLQSYDSLPVHSYSNFSENTVTYDVKLLVTSPLECKDSTTRTISVHPFIKGSLAVDMASSCSPVLSTLSPANSIGVDTFLYTIGYPETIQKIKNLTDEDITVAYSDTTYLNGPDTITAELIVQNQMGCTDTVPTKNIIVLPEVHAKFDIDTNRICSSSDIFITNESFGQNLIFTWDFGDGSSARDSTLRSFLHTYYNLEDVEKTYQISLEGINEYLCQKTFDTLITVNPHVNAFFTIENENNCAPLNLQINNYSHGVGVYEWDFGDGSPSDNSSLPVIYHDYTNPLEDRDTTYVLSLMVTSPEGCLDSMQRNVHILPLVIADFEMSESEGCSPIAVAFQNNSKGMDLLFNWQFGDLVKSNNNLTFSETFTNYDAIDSTFNIVLTAINPQGCESQISGVFTLYPYVNAQFGVDNTASCSPFIVNTSNYSSAGSKFYSWDFGDGTTSSAFEPSNEYTNTFLNLRSDTLKLIVKNDHECYDTAMKLITIYPEIHADFQTSVPAGCQPLEITFENNTNIIPNTSFFWDFDDGTHAAVSSPEPHTFTNNTPGSIFRDINLTAVSQYICSDTISRQIEIYPEIYAFFVLDRPAICSGDTFKLDRSGSHGGITEYLWDFNSDGIIDDTRSDNRFDFSFTNTSQVSATMNIKLTVTNSQGCDTSWTRDILVHPAVEAGFTVDQDEVCYPHNSVFLNNSENKGVVATKFYWNFGDGTVSTSGDDQITHSFWNFTHDTDREFVVTLNAESDFFCKGSFKDTVTVHPKPKADFDFPVNSDCPPFEIAFSDNSSGAGLSYGWDFDNGNTSEIQNPSEVFYNDGTAIIEKEIQLTVTSISFCSDTITKPISIYPRVRADFEVSEWEGCSPMDIIFDGTSVNEAIVQWDVDGNSFSTVEDPAYRLVNETSETKIFDITFKATSANRCMADTTKQITVYASPLAEFIPAPSIQDFNTASEITPVTFSNYTNHQGSNAWEFQWDYGDGSEDNNTTQFFIKNYAIWGDIHNDDKIPVWLTVWNKERSACRDSVLHHIIIHPPVPAVDIAEDLSGCSPFTVDFSSTTKYIYDDSYYWEFGVNNESSTEPMPAFTFTEAGTYSVKLTVEGDGGTNWDHKLITVYPKPSVDFVFSPKLVMLASTTEDTTEVNFFNNTQPLGSFIWDFGDGTTSAEYQPTHVYTETGEFYVTLIAATSEGCMDTMLHPIPVVVKGARKLEFPNAFIVDPSGPAGEYYDPAIPDKHIFRPVAEGVLKYRLEIYNRWGELIFVSEDIHKGWNGYINGTRAKQDVYIWRVKATFTDGQPYIAAGDVTLLVVPYIE